MPNRTIVLILFFLIGVTGFVPSAQAQNDIVSYTKVGQKMPLFSINDTDGKSISVSDSKDKVLLINFWATWCLPCYAELPELEKNIWLKFKSDDFIMVAIAREQSNQEITAYKNKLGFTFPIASDLKREIYSLFGNGGIPRNYVVYGGDIIYQSVGYDEGSVDEMKKVIDAALKKIKKTKKEK